MVHTFKRRRGAQAGAVAASAFMVLAFGWIALMFPLAPARVLAALAALVIAWFGLSALVNLLRPDPILTIGPDGILFQAFSPRTVPWSDIVAVTQRQGYLRVRDGSGGRIRITDKDTFSYAIGAPASYPKTGSLWASERAVNGNEVRLDTFMLIDAQPAELLEALKAHYKGAIAYIPAPRIPAP